MRASILGFICFVWIIGAILGSTFEYHDTEDTWAGTGTGGYQTAPVTTFQYLINVKNAVQRSEILGGIPIPVPNTEYFDTAIKVTTWQFSFWYDDDGTFVYGLVYYIMILPICIIGIATLLFLIYGVLTGNLTIS